MVSHLCVNLTNLYCYPYYRDWISLRVIGLVLHLQYLNHFSVQCTLDCTQIICKRVYVLLIKSLTKSTFQFLPVFKRHAPDAVIVDEI